LHFTKSKTAALAGDALATMNAQLINKTNEALGNMGTPVGVVNAANNTLGGINKITEDAKTVSNLWAPLFEKLGLFMRIMDGISDVSGLEILAICRTVF
jgi:hypothetical protein